MQRDDAMVVVSLMARTIASFPPHDASECAEPHEPSKESWSNLHDAMIILFDLRQLQ